MSQYGGKNEGFHILDEFICQAIPASRLNSDGTPPSTTGDGKQVKYPNDGIPPGPEIQPGDGPIAPKP
jgi:hypothetical protein